MDDKKKYILSKVSELYIAHGIKNVTMDDVAEKLCISKKTLYQYFEDKASLIESVLAFYMGQHIGNFIEIEKSSCNAIDKLYAASKIIGNVLASVPAVVLVDLNKYYPEILAKYKQQKRSHVLEQIISNLKDGIKQGLYRKNLDIDIASKSYMALSETMLDSNYFEPDNYSAATVFNEMFMYHLRGIASEKGLDYIEKNIKNLLKNKK